MLRIFFVLVNIMLVSNYIYSQKRVDCEANTKIRLTTICLPSLKGQKLISNDFDYKDFIEKFTYQGNEIIGFYINRDKPEYEYVSVFVNSKYKQDVNTALFKKMYSSVGFSIRKTDDLELIIKNIEDNYLENISLDRPTLVDSYSLNSKLKTCILLGKKIELDNEIITISTLNLMHLKGKIVLSNYLIKYENSNSINELKQKNDYFLMRIFNANN